jgi:large subunit ribosomal protein L19e
MNLKNQRRIAADIMGVGVRRVLIPEDSAGEVAEALTREDVRILIHNGVIKKRPEKSPSRGRARERETQEKKGRHRGYGRRKGRKTARGPRKEAWITKIRAIRDEIQKLRKEGKITESNYRKIYLQAKGNLFHSRRHLREHIERSKT